MREILTILAAILILILTSALVGPYFVDWTQHRAWIEAQLSDTAGAEVHIDGAIEISLLPSPRLFVERVRLSGSRPGDPSLKAASMRMEMAASPLMRGELRFTEMMVETPELTLTMAADGSPILPAITALPAEKLVLDRLIVSNGLLTISDPARARQFTLPSLALDAEAASLIGPYKGSGRFGAPDAPTSFRFNTGVREAERWRLKLIVDEAVSTPRMDFDGAILFGADRGGRISLGGPVILSSSIRGVPWRATGALTADTEAAEIQPLELRAGTEDRALSASGVARVDYGGSPEIKLDLKARQVDIDRLFGEGGDAPRKFGDAVVGLVDSTNLGIQIPLDIRLSSPAVTLGGDTLSEVAGRLDWRAGRPVGFALEASGPGRSHVALDGLLETGVAAKFAGKVDAAFRDMSRFEDWLGSISAELAGRLRALPLRSFEIAGDLDISRAGFSGRNLTIKADRSTYAGALSYTTAVGNDRARLFADLTSPALDLDGLPELTGPAAAAADIDLAISLEARAVRLARIGEGMIDAGRISGKVTKTGSDFRLDNFAIANLGGAQFTATGATGSAGTKLDARLDATRLVDLADLVKRVAPGRLADMLAARAVALSPARFNLKLDAPGGANEAARRGTLTFDATARGTTMRGSAKPDPASPGALAVVATLEAPEAASLLRQLGLETVALTGVGRGRVNFSANGDPAKGLDAKLDASLAGTDITYAGRIASLASGAETIGDLKLSGRNANTLLQVLGVSAPDPAAVAIPLDLTSSFSWKAETLRFDRLVGQVGTSQVVGALTLAPQTAPGASASRLAVGGLLQFDRLAFSSIAGLAFGPAQAPRTGALWSDQRFGLSLATPPEVAIKLAVGRLDLVDAISASKISASLGLAPGSVTLSDLSMSVAGGDASGKVVLRRDGATAAMSGNLKFADVSVDRPFATATLDGALDFTATGQTQAALVGSLAGTGSVTVSDFRIPRADPDAVDRVVAMVEKEQVPAAEPNIRSNLGLELDKAPLSPAVRTFDANMAAGVLRLAARPGAPVETAFSIDLRNFSVDQRLTLTGTKLPKDWNDAPPQAMILWKGPLANPTRTIDVSNMGNVLSARAIARETARVQALESDIRERAFFNRRLKGLQFIKQREGEVAAWEAEQARLAAEAEKRRIEEEKRLAAEAEKRRIEDEKRRVEEERKAAIEAARLEREQKAREAAEAARQAAETARLEREQRIRDAAEALRIERERRAQEAAQPRAPQVPLQQTPAVQTPVRPIAPPPSMLVPGEIDPAAAGGY